VIVQRKRTSRSAYTRYGGIAIALLLLLTWAFLVWWGWSFYWVWMVAINAVTFWFFRLDKVRAAEWGQMRVPEIVLLLMMIGGGVIGGLGGMLVRPRHKVRKPRFWLVLAVSALLHAYLLFGPLSM
jgi:uncharacterized membrane protein YsdA (DUF1294 family)